MKGRSHRLQSHDVHEDWVDGSWTVDCVCGVNFDDGEEMVNCDECGVWVHTRCSRYVKGEESFACDKCKNKNNRDDSEETEVAQLLVELPTKTIRLESSYATTGPGPARRPFRLWTDMPMEERVHVQGVPGGDPALFTGLSIFTPELWKCTGYVPKKFNFQYREFPCWDEEYQENAIDNGASVLFSLDKETMLQTSASALAGMRNGSDEGTLDKKVYAKRRKNWANGDDGISHSQIEVTKQRSLLRPIVIHSGKRKKEDLAMPKERSGKKKARPTYKEGDLKKRVSYVSKTALTSTSDAKPLAFYGDRRPKSIKNDKQNIKNQNHGDSIVRERESDVDASLVNGVEKSKNSVPVIERSSETLSADISGHDFGSEVKLNGKIVRREGPGVAESSSKFDNIAGSTPEHIVQKLPMEREGEKVLNGNLSDNMMSSVECDEKPAIDGLVTTVSDAKDNQIKGDNDMSSGSLQPNFKLDADNDNSSRLLNSQSYAGDAKDIGAPSNDVNENLKTNNLPVSCSSTGRNKTQDTEIASEAISNHHASKHTEIKSDHFKVKRELDGLQGRTPLQKCSSEPKLGLALANEPSKLGESTSHSVALPSQNKIVLCLGKSSSASATLMISKSSLTDTARSADKLDSYPTVKQQALAECNSNTKKDRAASDMAKLKDEDGQDMSRKAAKDRLKPSVFSSSKTPIPSKILHASNPRRALSDSKDSALHSSAKTSLAQNSSEAAGLPQNECPSLVQNKAVASGAPPRGEKLNHFNSQSSSKGNHASSVHPLPTNSSATLSDEELALLLHQELNSSPRVPRVPRVRNAGSMPQLATPSATSFLIKRTSGYGGRDHNSVPRRKNKDTSKDGFSRSHEPDDESKKTDTGSSSLDLSRRDTGYTTDELPKREGAQSPAAVHSVKKNILSTSTSTVNSGPSSSAENNDNLNSPGNMSDEETGIVQVPVHRTLPGLINEIMSKGRRMTYEELCNAVLPHWHNLRKHNGERYAYSSHSQAVLDCLRNRHEWAQLVDRGPKTNSSRKRRMVDAEESGENPVKEGDSSKSLEEPQRDEYPKGKRKARKRRRMALQGRGIKELRRRKAYLGSDDESGPFSNSSEDSVFSDNETWGGVSDASASSDETGTT